MKIRVSYAKNWIVTWGNKKYSEEREFHLNFDSIWKLSKHALQEIKKAPHTQIMISHWIQVGDIFMIKPNIEGGKQKKKIYQIYDHIDHELLSFIRRGFINKRET